MGPQSGPQYRNATSIADPIIIQELQGKYGADNVCWPIVLIQGQNTIAYVYERNQKNQINTLSGVRPQSKKGLPNHSVDYRVQPRIISPSAQFLDPFIEPQYKCSYDYVTDSPYSTVDLDYVWKNGGSWRGLELTTFYMEFSSRARAEELVHMLPRRPSWQGPEGPHGMIKIIEAAEDLGVELYMACVNTIGKVGSAINTRGNALWFPLTLEQLKRISSGAPLIDCAFDRFSVFAAWL